jgi:hypothetical protein
MGDFRFRKLREHQIGGSGDEMVLSVPVPRNPSGKIYQYSPNPEAVPRLFQIGEAPDPRTISPEHLSRIRRQPGPGQTVCPYSGIVAPDAEFVHFNDVEAVKKQIEWAVKEDVGAWLEDLAADFNRRQPRGGFLSVSMGVKRPQNPKPFAIREDLLRDMRCGICARQYGVYAIGLFCPDCGAPNVALHFQREGELVRQQVAIADEQAASDRSELAYRLLGNAHEDVLTAFEATLKAVYCHLIRRDLPDQAEKLCAKRGVGNAFQNISRARELFGKLNIDPFAALSAEDLGFLRLNIQKRHVIGHNLGIADEHYAELMQEEQPGETVRILGGEIARFADVCIQAVVALEENLLPNADRPDAGACSCLPSPPETL